MSMLIVAKLLELPPLPPHTHTSMHIWLLSANALWCLPSGQGQSCDQLRLTSDCNCERSMVTYECAITGGVSTQWQVSDCEITLQQLDIARGTAEGDCLNGQIIGCGIRNDSNCYISSLTLLELTSDLINETVRCLVDDGLQTHLIDNTTITVTGIYACYS